jgi:hypothetical protein
LGLFNLPIDYRPQPFSARSPAEHSSERLAMDGRHALNEDVRQSAYRNRQEEKVKQDADTSAMTPERKAPGKT